MFELRWLLDKNFPRSMQAPLEAYTLQYRWRVSEDEWSEWKDVPYVDEADKSKG